MSIPPFVCSTPPPPEQCEDDKDHDDFDLQYQLPQEDDDDEHYDYSNYSSYHFQPETSSKNVETIAPTSKNNESIFKTAENHNIVNDAKDTQLEVNECNINESTVKDKLKCEEDLNIEDLNLIVDKESICIDSDQKQSPSDRDQCAVKNHNIPCDKNEDNLNDDNDVEITSLSRIEPIIPNDVEDIGIYDESKIQQEQCPETLDTSIVLEHVNETICDKEIYNSVEDVSEKLENVLNNEFAVYVDTSDKIDDLECIPNLNIEQVVNPCEQIECATDNELTPKNTRDINESDEDFAEFDDFQFNNPVRKTSTVVDDIKDPWCNEEPVESDFGNFTANFDQIETQQANQYLPVNTLLPENNQVGNNINKESSQSDDFGDFDDFQSSSIDTKENATKNVETYQDVPVLNLPSSDNEPLVLDSINKVLSAVFDEEITDPGCEFDVKLESFLSETWGHLMEIDVRQPYIVNWNNSLGQKTLLKSLCIDSRNILFGPKWSYNMPRYAANLNSAPLQPQRQSSLDSNHSENMNIDKATIKASNWEDPFTSEGRDSCNSNQVPTTESGLADIHVFGEAMSSKVNKVYPNTLEIQPIRQISLPDTHIFTPTDSETPRSKTIHYDSGLPVLLPRSIKDDSKNEIESTPVEPSSSNIPASNDDSDYWEFQDFKGTNTGIKNELNVDEHSQIPGTSVAPKPVSPKTTLGYQTQLLQPIKLDPVMPTLNWPDPGQVKETFDDFSDFVSNSNWSNENSISVSPEKALNPNITPISTSLNVNQIDEPERTKHESESPSDANDDFDDDFATFKSAPPASSNVTPAPQSTLAETPKAQLDDFEFRFSKIEVKSESTSSASETKPSISLNTGHISNITQTITKPQTILSPSIQILQPITASPAVITNQQNTGQILQPLSLESYSQINWPSPGIDLQDLSRFNPVETLQSLKTDLSAANQSKHSSPVHNQRHVNTNQVTDDDVWGEFVSSKPKQQVQPPKKSPAFGDDDEWTDFVSSPSVMPQNGLNTISLNVHASSNMKSANQNKFNMKNNQRTLDIPTLNYITPKTNNHKAHNDRHFQNL